MKMAWTRPYEDRWPERVGRAGVTAAAIGAALFAIIYLISEGPSAVSIAVATAALSVGILLWHVRQAGLYVSDMGIKIVSPYLPSRTFRWDEVAGAHVASMPLGFHYLVIELVGGRWLRLLSLNTQFHFAATKSDLERLAKDLEEEKHRRAGA